MEIGCLWPIIFEFGSYKVLTVGSLSDSFRILDDVGRELVPGKTTLQQVTVALKREADIVDFEFPHLYFGEVVKVDHLPSNTSHQVYQVNLIRNTNRFNIVLMKYGENEITGNYTFEIQTPEVLSILGRMSPQTEVRLPMCLTIQVKVRLLM